MTGFCWVLVASILWAASATVAKFTFHGVVSPIFLSIIRVVIAAPAFGVWNLVHRASFRLTRRQLGLVTLQGMACLIMGVTYYEAIRTTNVAIAIMLQYTAPVFVAIYAVAIGNERMRMPLVIGLIMSLVGCFLMVGGYKADVLHLNGYGTVVSRRCPPFTPR